MAVNVIQDGGIVRIVQSAEIVKIMQPKYALKITTGIVEAEAYDGAYVATPSWNQQSFATSGKLMNNNFVVNSIVEREVPNDAGGLTLTI